MPNPIPDWELPRRLLKYVGTHQIIGEPVTVRETTVTLGIGRERVESILKEKEIIYKIFSGTEPSGNDILAIQCAPPNLTLDAGVSNRELDTSFRKLLDQEQRGELQIVRRERKRMNKRQREKLRVAEFWGR